MGFSFWWDLWFLPFPFFSFFPAGAAAFSFRGPPSRESLTGRPISVGSGSTPETPSRIPGSLADRLNEDRPIRNLFFKFGMLSSEDGFLFFPGIYLLLFRIKKRLPFGSCPVRCEVRPAPACPGGFGFFLPEKGAFFQTILSFEMTDTQSNYGSTI